MVAAGGRQTRAEGGGGRDSINGRARARRITAADGRRPGGGMMDGGVACERAAARGPRTYGDRDRDQRRDAPVRGRAARIGGGAAAGALLALASAMRRLGATAPAGPGSAPDAADAASRPGRAASRGTPLIRRQRRGRVARAPAPSPARSGTDRAGAFASAVRITCLEQLRQVGPQRARRRRRLLDVRAHQIEQRARPGTAAPVTASNSMHAHRVDVGARIDLPAPLICSGAM